MGRRFVLFSLQAAVLPVLLLAGLLLGGGCDFAKVDENTPGFAFKEFIEHVGNAEYAEAHELMSASFKENAYSTPDDLAEAVADGYFPIYYEMNVVRADVDSTEAILSWQAKYSNDTDKEFLHKGEAQMVLEGDEWKVSGFFGTPA